MSSVMATEICKQCSFGEADSIFELDTNSYRVYCPVCGYVYEFFPKNEEADGEKIYCKDEDGRFIYTEKEYRGFGVSCIKRLNGAGRVDYLNEPITQEDVAGFNKFLSEEEGIDLENSFLREWKDGVVITRAGSETSTWRHL